MLENRLTHIGHSVEYHYTRTWVSLLFHLGPRHLCCALVSFYRTELLPYILFTWYCSQATQKTQPPIAWKANWTEWETTFAWKRSHKLKDVEMALQWIPIQLEVIVGRRGHTWLHSISCLYPLAVHCNPSVTTQFGCHREAWWAKPEADTSHSTWIHRVNILTTHALTIAG